jgi:Cu/Ag efflux pump CusA
MVTAGVAVNEDDSPICIQRVASYARRNAVRRNPLSAELRRAYTAPYEKQADRLATLDGVANLQIYGERSFAVRIWIDRRALAARKLTVVDVERALVANNVELPAGEVKSRNRQLTVRLNSRLQSVEDFRAVVIDRVAGYAVRLGDVARVEPGVADDTTVARSDGRGAVGMGVLRQSQANTLEISNAVRAEIDRLRPTLPEGMEIIVGSDDALFVGASIREVVTALFISLGLVVAVILVFLRSLRATLVPVVAIPVSLVGVLVLLSIWGFSINTLTLLALLLAIGLVAPASFMQHFIVFVLSVFIGFQVIWNVSHSLHTPLMAVTNAISSIIILGALMQIGSGSWLVIILAALSVFMAGINIFGGFLVTRRMLAMFQKS